MAGSSTVSPPKAPAFAEAAGLWFDKRKFHDFKLDAPTTWNELLSCARALRSAQPGHPLAFPGGTAGGETTAFCLTGFLASNGVTIMEGDHVNVGSAESVQTLRFLRRLVTDECISPAAVGYSWDHPINLLASGETAMTIGGRTRVALEREKTLVLRSIKELEFDFAMGKIAKADFDEMSGRLRARALGLMRQLDAGGGYREQIAKEVADRLASAQGAQGAQSQKLHEISEEMRNAAGEALEPACIPPGANL